MNVMVIDRNLALQDSAQERKKRKLEKSSTLSNHNLDG